MLVKRLVGTVLIGLAILIGPVFLYGMVRGAFTESDFSSDDDFAQFLWSVSIVCTILYGIGAAVYFGTKLANQDRDRR